eukprot:353336-Chlamydomonas_euryale.AAC.15
MAHLLVLRPPLLPPPKQHTTASLSSTQAAKPHLLVLHDVRMARAMQRPQLCGHLSRDRNWEGVRGRGSCTGSRRRLDRRVLQVATHVCQPALVNRPTAYLQTK